MSRGEQIKKKKVKLKANIKNSGTDIEVRYYIQRKVITVRKRTL